MFILGRCEVVHSLFAAVNDRRRIAHRLIFCLAALVFCAPAQATGPAQAYDCQFGGFRTPDQIVYHGGTPPSDLSAMGPDGAPLAASALIDKIAYSYHAGAFEALGPLVDVFKTRAREVIIKSGPSHIVYLIAAADILHDRDALAALLRFLLSQPHWLDHSPEAFAGSVYSGRVILPYLEGRIAFMDGRSDAGWNARLKLSQVEKLISDVLPFVTDDTLADASVSERAYIEAGYFEDGGKISFMLAALYADLSLFYYHGKHEFAEKDTLAAARNFVGNMIGKIYDAESYLRPGCSARLLSLMQALLDNMPSLEDAANRNIGDFDNVDHPIDILKREISHMNSDQK